MTPSRPLLAARIRATHDARHGPGDATPEHPPGAPEEAGSGPFSPSVPVARDRPKARRGATGWSAETRQQALDVLHTGATLATAGKATGVPKSSQHVVVASRGIADARRTLVSALLDRGVDLSAVADVAGHVSVMTTSKYDRRGDARLIAASREAALPLVAWPGC